MQDFLIHLWTRVSTESKCWRDKHKYQKQRRGKKRSGKKPQCPFMIFIKKSLLFGAFSRWKTSQASCWKSGLCFSFTHSAWSKCIHSFLPLLEKMPLLFKHIIKNNSSRCGCCEGIHGFFPWVLTCGGDRTGRITRVWKHWCWNLIYNVVLLNYWLVWCHSSCPQKILKCLFYVYWSTLLPVSLSPTEMSLPAWLARWLWQIPWKNWGAERLPS